MSEPVTGYEVTITRERSFDGLGIETRHVVCVRRLSDDARTARSFEWRWRARRFGRSPRRLGKAFAADAAWKAGEVEKFTIGWEET